MPRACWRIVPDAPLWQAAARAANAARSVWGSIARVLEQPCTPLGSPDRQTKSGSSRGGCRTRVHKRQAQQVAVSERVALQTSQQETR